MSEGNLVVPGLFANILAAFLSGYLSDGWSFITLLLTMKRPNFNQFVVIDVEPGLADSYIVKKTMHDNLALWQWSGG